MKTTIIIILAVWFLAVCVILYVREKQVKNLSDAIEKLSEEKDKYRHELKIANEYVMEHRSNYYELISNIIRVSSPAIKGDNSTRKVLRIATDIAGLFEEVDGKRNLYVLNPSKAPSLPLK